MALHQPTTLSSSRVERARRRRLQHHRRRRVARQCQQPATPLMTPSRPLQKAPRDRTLPLPWPTLFKRSRRKQRRGRPFPRHPMSARPNDDACSSHPKNPTTKHRHHHVFPSSHYQTCPPLRPPRLDMHAPRRLRSGRLLLEALHLTSMTLQTEKRIPLLQDRARATISTTFTSTSRSLARTRRCPLH